MARTYYVSGYIVDTNSSAYSAGLLSLLSMAGFRFEGLGVLDKSPEWEWDDDCPENNDGGLVPEEYEKRFPETLAKDPKYGSTMVHPMLGGGFVKTVAFKCPRCGHQYGLNLKVALETGYTCKCCGKRIIFKDGENE